MGRTIRVLAMVLVLGLTASAVFAGAEFNYQGQVSVKGTPFNGTGQFKLAILNEAGNSTYWSQDGSSENGSEPTGFLSVPVTDGIFNIIVGDTKIPGMQKLSPTVLNEEVDLFLRVWFSDGMHGFQMLLPDRKITNTDLLGRESGDQEIMLYVNGATGNDKNSGLKLSKPKKTIQAAVDTLPGRIDSNVQIQIADGIYREQVSLYGISVSPNRTVTLQGNSTSASNVRITGCDDDSTKTPVRDWGILIEQCSRIRINGILVDYAKIDGMKFIQSSSIVVTNCIARHTGYGGSTDSPNAGFKFFQSNGNLVQCEATDNSTHGMYWGKVSAGRPIDCSAFRNGFAGITVHANSTIELQGTCEASDNGYCGFYSMHNSMLHYSEGLTVIAKNNHNSGIAVLWHSYTQGHPTFSFSGNPINIETGYGSATYD